MSGFRLHSPTAISSSIYGDAWHGLPSDQQSKNSGRSVGTIQRASKYGPSTPSPGSARSLGSNSSARLQDGNENLMARRELSHSSLRGSQYSTKTSPITRTSKQASYRSTWGTDIPPPPDKQRFSSLLAEAGPLEDIDLNSHCGESLYSRHESTRDADDNADRGLSFDIRKHETLSTPRLPSNASQEDRAPRSFNIATEHLFQSENPLKRLIDTLRSQGPKGRHSLTVRKERWTLDDFDETKPNKFDLPQSRRPNGHQKASSWSSSGVRDVIRSATVRLQSKMDRPRSPMFSTSHFLRSNRSSRIANTASRASMDGEQVVARVEEKIARARAVQRRRILEELITSEESYVADLKVLLHVRNP